VPALNPQPLPETLIYKLSALPRDRIAEVEDFVDFIGQREVESVLSRAALEASGPAFARVWNNPEDDVYDAL